MIHYADVAIACDDHHAAAALYERLVPYAGQLPTRGCRPVPRADRPLPRQARHPAAPLRAGRPPLHPRRRIRRARRRRLLRHRDRPGLGPDVPPAPASRRRTTGPCPPRLGTIRRHRRRLRRRRTTRHRSRATARLTTTDEPGDTSSAPSPSGSTRWHTPPGRHRPDSDQDRPRQPLRLRHGNARGITRRSGPQRCCTSALTGCPISLTKRSWKRATKQSMCEDLAGSSVGNHLVCQLLELGQGGPR